MTLGPAPVHLRPVRITGPTTDVELDAEAMRVLEITFGPVSFFTTLPP